MRHIAIFTTTLAALLALNAILTFAALLMLAAPAQAGVVVTAFPDEARARWEKINRSARAWVPLARAYHDLRLVWTFRGHEGSVLSAAFSPDGARIVTAPGDSAARVWESLPLHQLVDRARAKVEQAQALSPEQECEFYLRTEGCER